MTSNKAMSHKQKKTFARKLAGPGESIFLSPRWLERKALIRKRVEREQQR